ncbi:hypothetical protein [Paracidovorax avenae]|uniref:hypothetical protein n=1 Tax=Paracidovorax avenae TaxID=80867 RepID=UPI001863A2A6|nr:hypothetical protein [Paracidovorax avenae]
MKVIVWIYAVVGTLYFLLYSAGIEVVERYAVGPLWLLMVAAPVLLLLLVFLPIALR